MLRKQLLVCCCLLLIFSLFSFSSAQADNFASWTDSASNPLFGGATSGVDRAYYPAAIKVGSVYHIWYGDGSNTRHASSTNFDFSGVTFPATPVTGLAHSATPPVTAAIYHPRVLHNASGWNIGGNSYAGPFLMYYTIYYSDSRGWTESPRVAHSADGISWNYIGECTGVNSFSGGTIYNFDVVYEGGTTWKAYADNGQGHIEYYVSTNGINWTGTAHNILGSLQAWETSFTSPHVFETSGQYVMYYGSGLSNNNKAFGVAFSTDGQTFTKSSNNPILSTTGAPSWRDDRTYTPYVIEDGLSWRMYFTGRSTTGGVYSIGYATLTPFSPTGSITINSGDVSTNTLSATLSFSCTDISTCSQMCISNTSTCSSWESYLPTKAWTLTAGDGTKTVYVWFKNSLDNSNVSPYTDSIILTGPYSVSTQSGSNVTVPIPNGTTVTYAGVTSSCSTTLTTDSTPDHNPPPGYKFIGGESHDISTTNCSYTGPVTVVIPYDESEVAGQEQNLKLFHFENGAWVDVTVSVNTANNTITGSVNTLSPFGVGYPFSGYDTGANTNMIVVIALLFLASGIYLIKRRSAH